MVTCWRVMALSRLDLPTLRRPKMPMCSRKPLNTRGIDRLYPGPLEYIPFIKSGTGAFIGAGVSARRTSPVARTLVRDPICHGSADFSPRSCHACGLKPRTTDCRWGGRPCPPDIHGSADFSPRTVAPCGLKPRTTDCRWGGRPCPPDISGSADFSPRTVAHAVRVETTHYRLQGEAWLRPYRPARGIVLRRIASCRTVLRARAPGGL